MSFIYKSAWLYYKKSSFEYISSLPLKDQLFQLQNTSVLVLDFCGGISKYRNMFLNLNAKIYLISNEDEPIKVNYDSFDAIFVMVYQGQNILLSFDHFRIVLSKNRILESKYIAITNTSKQNSNCEEYLTSNLLNFSKD